MEKDRKEHKRRIFGLFLTFLRIGAFTFGGGYAMIPLIQREIVTKKRWMTDDDILEITAIAESTPGPIAVNSATFVGYRVGGFFGAAAATFGVVLPSFVIITIISFVLKEFESLRAVRYAFFGIRAGVLALLVSALVTMAKRLRGVLGYIIAAGAFLAAGIFGFPVIPTLACCAAAGFTGTLAPWRRKGRSEADETDVEPRAEKDKTDVEPCAEMDKTDIAPCAEMDKTDIAPCAEKDKTDVEPCAETGGTSGKTNATSGKTEDTK